MHELLMSGCCAVCIGQRALLTANFLGVLSMRLPFGSRLACRSSFDIGQFEFIMFARLSLIALMPVDFTVCCHHVRLKSKNSR